MTIRDIFAVTVASTLSAAAPSPVSSQNALSASSLLDACSRADEAWVSFCNGYAQGVVDFLELSGGACIPPGTTRTTIVTLIDQSAFPKIRDGSIAPESPALAVALEVLKTAYPC
jgi:hypothetical protein